MKKQYLRISIAAFFFAALIFSTSCSKKSSDDPKPATTPTTPTATATKPAAPNTESRKSVAADDGTGRPPVTEIPVNGVKVQDTENQRAEIKNQDNKDKLDNLTGRNPIQGRFEGDPARTDFGWIVSDLTINGTSFSDQDIFDDNSQSIFFFNIDSSGYYWQFENKSKTWTWGTFGIDTAMTTIAFDFDLSSKPTEIWKINKVTKDRLVISGDFDLDEDGQTESVVMGLNAFDLTDDQYSGETEPVLGQETFVGSWERFELVTTLINDPNDPRFGLIDSSYNSLQDKLYINVDGTYNITSSTGNDNGSWVLERIPSDDPTEAPVYYLYPTYYDAETKTIKTDTYVMSIEGDVMVMIKITDPQPANPETLYFQRK